MADFIPGINVGNAFRQLGSVVGLAPKGDYDVLDRFTNSGRKGQVQMALPDVTTGDKPSVTAGASGIANGFDVGNIIGGITGGIPSGGGSTGGGVAVDPQLARVAKLRGDIRGYQDDVASVYQQLFADLDALIKSRTGEIDKTAGDNINQLTDKYVGSIPGIESSYASLGAGNSTDTTYAKVGAKKGYEDSVKQVGEQKNKDLATLGDYDQTTRAGWNADRDALNRIFSRLDETDNENDLADARSTVEGKLGTAKANRASLMTDKGLRGAISKATDSESRMGSIQGSLDSILNSSLSGAVKQAAIEAVGQSAGLSDEEKNQIKANSAYTS